MIIRKIKIVDDWHISVRIFLLIVTDVESRSFQLASSTSSNIESILFSEILSIIFELNQMKKRTSSQMLNKRKIIRIRKTNLRVGCFYDFAFSMNVSHLEFSIRCKQAIVWRVNYFLFLSLSMFSFISFLFSCSFVVMFDEPIKTKNILHLLILINIYSVIIRFQLITSKNESRFPKLFLRSSSIRRRFARIYELCMRKNILFMNIKRTCFFSYADENKKICQISGNKFSSCCILYLYA